MSFNWPEFTIDELKAPIKGAIAMGPFGSRIKAENFVESGVPVLKGGNLHGAYINDSDCDFLTEEKADELKSSVVYEGDIVITHRGTIGQVSIVSDESKYPRYVVSQSQLKISLDKTKVNPYYVNYYLRSRLGQHQLLSFASQVGVPAIAKASTSVKQIRVPCPPLTVQDKIVDFVRVIDRKHTNNRTVNQTLEQMAQAIFKSWFVDFEPVKAKMNGEQPEGMDAATASLFPEKLVESELGLIPEGWEPKQLKDILELAYGKALKKTDRVEGNVPVYGSGGLTGYHNQSLVEGPGIIVGRKGTVGSVYWEPKAFYPIDTVFYVKPKTGYSLKYCHLVLQNLGLKDMNTDAAVPGLNRNNAYRLDVITPNEPVLKKFEEMTQSFQLKVDANNAQNASLESLRDTLLPKLLSRRNRVRQYCYYRNRKSYGVDRIMTPPFTLNSRILTLVASISEQVGKLNVSADQSVDLRLRRINQVRTIHGTLAIEGNELSEAQITAILSGKRVIAPVKEVQEAKNAITVYEKLLDWKPEIQDDMLQAHQTLMMGLLDTAGQYRAGGVGVMKEGKVIHMAPPASRVTHLMEELFTWLASSDDHALIKSCVFHYEFEFIHPFSDGNGRMGRLWQTLILSQWQPLFAHLPVENLIHQNQDAYYHAINISTQSADSAPFIEFMLSMIEKALNELDTVSEPHSLVAATPQERPHVTPQVKMLLEHLIGDMSREELQILCQLKDRKSFSQRYLKPALEAKLIEMTIPDNPRSRSQRYRLTQRGQAVKDSL